MTAGEYRDEGYTVAFFEGRVHLYKPGHPAVSQLISEGRWMKRPNGWEGVAVAVEQKMIAIRAACQCSVGGVSRYCMGGRL